MVFTLSLILLHSFFTLRCVVFLRAEKFKKRAKVGKARQMFISLAKMFRGQRRNINEFMIHLRKFRCIKGSSLGPYQGEIFLAF